MSKMITADFFDIKTPLSALLDSVYVKQPEGRNFTFNDGPVRLRILKKDGGCYFGDMMRIRLHEPAMLANVHGGEKAISKTDDEGLGETNAFKYSPDRKILLYQRNRSGVSWTKFSYYLQQLNNLDKAIIFEPVLKPATVDQLINSEGSKKIHLSFRPAGIAQDGAKDNTLDEIITAAKNLGSQTCQITFSMGREKKFLEKNAVVKMVKNLLKLKEQGHEVSALDVNCSDNGASELINFIDSVMSASMPIEPTNLVDTFYERRIMCLEAMWEVNAHLIK